MKRLYFKFLIFMVCLLVIIITIPTIAVADHNNNEDRACTKTARFLKFSCDFAVRDDYLKGIAICLNISDEEGKKECLRETRMVQREARQECRDVLRARKDLCSEIGEEPFDPPFGEDFADSFVNPLDIGKNITPNPYFPLVQGNQWIYQGTTVNDEGEEETETVTVTVTNETKLINGITCLTVNDVAMVDDVVVENTNDWFTQDTIGNIWYCGEIAENFESFEGDNPELPELVDVSGSWKAGRDGAKAGILLPFSPVIGEIIRQEVAWGEAEDVIEILATDGTETSPFASCNANCLVTRDFTPLDSEANENKYYSPGTGLIVEIDLNTGDRVELIDFTNTSTP